MAAPTPHRLSHPIATAARFAYPRCWMLAVSILALGLHDSVGADAECLRIAAGNAPYGDWSTSNVVWGDGYPTVNAVFSADESLVFDVEHGGGYRQKIGTNSLVSSTPAVPNAQNDNPSFIETYPNTLRLNALIADTGTIIMTYTLSFPTELVDIIIADVDEGDSVVVSATDAAGNAVAPASLQMVGEGDLSLTINAGGRPPLELATPPSWNAGTGTLAAQVTWNENRSFTILRPLPGVALKTITLTFTGNRADSDGPTGSGLGSHIYAALWATPRILEVLQFSVANPTQFLLRWTSLPGLSYRVQTNTELSEPWTQETTVAGAAAPAVATELLIPIPAVGPEFYRVVRP